MLTTLVATTPRLVLRPVAEEDAEPTAELVTPDVSESLLSWDYPTTAEQVIERVRNAQDKIERRLAVNWAILRKEDHQLLGWIRIAKVRGGLGSMGYWLGSKFRGQGYMREAASHAIAMASAFLSLEAIRADVFADNKASIALLEALAFRRCPRRSHSARTGWEKKLCRYRRDLAQR
jgi:ribosomal-protein-alanine N-acetyltransferase